MPKNNVQDIVIGSGRSIRRIPISKRVRTSRAIEKPRDLSARLGKSGNTEVLPPVRKKPSRFGLWAVAVFAVIILFVVISLLFGGVKVKVTPNQEAVAIDGIFIAYQNPGLNGLGYEIMTITKELTAEVKAEGEKFVEEYASGKIIIYNNYTGGTQRLITNTRFETQSGLIYRIREAVVVPGRKTVAGEIVPGSLEVTVYADKIGSNYNIPLSDFTIPGLKGDPRYSKFYARSKTAMTGGASGLVKSASPEDLAQATAALDSKLKADLLEEAGSVKPEGFLLLQNAYVINSDIKTSNGENDTVLITQKASFFGFIFDENELAAYIAQNTIATYDGGEVELADTDNLKINIDTIGQDEINFSLSGETKVVWTFDEEMLLSDLSGQSKKRVDSILSGYPSINQAEVVIRPFWKRSLPTKESKIKIERVIE